MVLLEVVARNLGDALREQLVFVGGAVAGLLITAPAMPAILREWFTRLITTPLFMEALAGHLPGDAASQERLPELERKLRVLAQLE